MRILLISDTHGELQQVKEILDTHRDMDAYIHLGDIGFPLQELSKFHMVCGNHDRDTALPKELILTFENRKILCIHGNLFDDETIEEVLKRKSIKGEDTMEVCMQTLYTKLADYAKYRGCDTLFFGHTHHAYAGWIKDVYLVNPGSICYGTPQSGYALVEIDASNITTKFYECTGIIEG